MPPLTAIVSGFDCFCMRFSVLADFVCGFAVLDEIFFGFAVSSIPQCPPPKRLELEYIMLENLSIMLLSVTLKTNSIMPKIKLEK